MWQQLRLILQPEPQPEKQQKHFEELDWRGQSVKLLRKKFYRGVRIKLCPKQGLQVTLSQSASPQEALKFLEQKAAWVFKQQARFEDAFLPPVEFSQVPGAHYPWQGEMKPLPFDLTQMGAAEAHALLCDYYRASAHEIIQPRLNFWSEITGLKPTKLSFRINQSRWGSCSSRGHINLNVKLLCLPEQLSDYVLVHELCHLRHLNHSREFWQLVERFLPEFRALERGLLRHQLIGEFLIRGPARGLQRS